MTGDNNRRLYMGDDKEEFLNISLYCNFEYILQVNN